MATTGTAYRLDGVYPQRQEGFFMQRIKLPAGVLSAEQARAVAGIAERFGRGGLHLTSRGSIEIHWVREPGLPELKQALAAVGLTSRGACGGAVRGVSCGSPGGYPLLETLARRLQRHFAGNPRFERLPKKFKIGLEADQRSGRHLIQDVGLVLARQEEGHGWYDVWVAGGLGREPQPGFLLAPALPETRLIPLLEAIIRVYAAHTPAGKRLKHLARELGEEELARRIIAEPTATEELPPVGGLPEHLLVPGERLEAPCFAGRLTAGELRRLADFAGRWAGGVLTVTGGQNIAFALATGVDAAAARQALAGAGFAGSAPEERIACRVCPGSHECLMGLAPTRDLARSILAALGPAAATLDYALSGCPNSCSQPQLAAVGIVTARLATGDDGRRVPRFDLYRRTDGGLGRRVAEQLSLAELVTELRRLDRPDNDPEGEPDEAAPRSAQTAAAA